MEIWKEFTFEAAHRLASVPLGHKCGRLHGHSFRARLYISGPLSNGVGWVLDFAEIKQVWDTYCGVELDHRYLNEVAGMGDDPTSERIAVWVWQRVKPLLPWLSAVEVSETCNSGVTYRGE